MLVLCQMRVEMRTIRALLVAFGVLGVLAVTADAGDNPSGAALYAEHCAACHGAKLEGQPNWRSPNPDGTLPAPPHDESGHTWHHGDQLLFDYVKDGGAATMAARGVAGFKSGMPGFVEVLSDREIREILAFLQSHWSPRARTYQKQASDAE